MEYPPKSHKFYGKKLNIEIFWEIQIEQQFDTPYF